MNLAQAKVEALKNPEFKKEWERYDLAFECGQMVVEARLRAGITQAELAKKVGTKQPSIARLENGSRLPSLGFLQKVLQVMDFEVHIMAGMRKSFSWTSITPAITHPTHILFHQKFFND